MVWSNGVIHHTTNYEECIAEFARVLKPKGDLFLYVHGRFGLFELLQDTVRSTNEEIPRALFQHYIKLLSVDSGRLYWIMDMLYAPYEYKSKEEVEGLLTKHGFKIKKQLLYGVDTDAIEQVSIGLPYAKIKYGEAQLRFLAIKEGS
jgi:ubiquinone/menaquinone biosynthesis C-methylase UbiE